MTHKKSKWTVKVAEGDVYAVPLPDGGYGRVVVSRKDRRGGLFGYFFGPRYDKIPSNQDSQELQPDKALVREIFGDLGIQENLWPPLGRIDPWDRKKWPLPQFGRIANEELGIAYICTYVNDDISKLPVTRRCSPKEARLYPVSGLFGSGAAAKELAKRIRGEKVPW